MSAYIGLKSGFSLQFQSSSITADIIVRQFSWAQWDPHLQSLFYVSVKSPQPRLMHGDEDDFLVEIAARPPQPSLSCLQFHDDLPHETVVKLFKSTPPLQLIFFVEQLAQHSTEFARGICPSCGLAWSR